MKNNILSSVLIATTTASVFMTLPVTVFADSSIAPTTTKAMNNCCGSSHNKLTASCAKKSSTSQKCSNKSKTTP